MSTETPTRISLRHNPDTIEILSDGGMAAAFPREPKASIAVEFLHTLDESVFLWESIDDPGLRLDFDDHSREHLENVRVLLTRLLWDDAEPIRLYRFDPPLEAANGTAVVAIRRMRDDQVLVHRQETIHHFAARCRPPSVRDPHPSNTPDEAPSAWAEWFMRNAGAVTHARVADYATDKWQLQDWSKQDGPQPGDPIFAMVEVGEWKARDPEDKDQYEMGA